MTTVREIQTAIQKLSPQEVEQLKEWFEDFFEDQLELSEEIKLRLGESQAQIASGQFRTRRP